MEYQSINYFILPHQSNIYGLSCLQTEGNTKVLIATVERQIFCMEYQKGLKPSFKEVQFTYIPNGADIISIDSFKRSKNSHDYVIGITFVKPRVTSAGPESSTEISEKYYFNIYASWPPLSEFNIDFIAQGCLTLEIDFVPYHLYHTHILTTNSNKEYIWLLSGSDSYIHCFRENKERQCFSEEPTNIYFPEFSNIFGIILWMDVFYIHENNENNPQRFTALGYETGLLKVSLTQYNVSTDSWEVLSCWTADFDCPIAYVKFFHDRNSDDFRNIENINLLIVNSLETSVVFRDVKNTHLNNMYKLPESKRVDCSVTGCVGDLDLDGMNEIAIGTFGHELISYKFDKGENKYKLMWIQMFSRPLQSLAYIDITGDGLKELLVLTNKGLHVLQHNLNESHLLLRKRINRLQSVIKNEDDGNKETILQKLKDHFKR
ncbi:kaptin-like protein [Dinothrombium tinctorium]|uniref:Kaptin-like protein n=1 Tax=Dinothrombium tinctorium TaxID=1965070 RepID=A0A443RMI3_9ACAR|nr:kaptin-like protein [Dinothrombium tinctorium]